MSIQFDDTFFLGNTDSPEESNATQTEGESVGRRGFPEEQAFCWDGFEDSRRLGLMLAFFVLIKNLMCSVGKELEETTILSPAEPAAATAASSSLPWHGPVYTFETWM